MATERANDGKEKEILRKATAILRAERTESRRPLPHELRTITRATKLLSTGFNVLHLEEANAFEYELTSAFEKRRTQRGWSSA